MFRCLFRAAFCACLLSICNSRDTCADVGDPLAVRNWGSGTVSVESHWGLRLVINPRDEDQPWDKADRVVSPGDELDHFLARRANSSIVTWLPVSAAKDDDPNSMHVGKMRPFGEVSILFVKVDGVSIIYVPKEWFAAQANEESITIKIQEITNPDLLILDTDDEDQIFDEGTMLLLKSVKPKKVLLNRIDVANQGSLDSIRNQFDSEQVIVHLNHNTVALSHSATEHPTEFVIVANKPWDMPDELGKLFVSMEKANSDSQRVFAKLSANQLNFKPVNGTHTPRWNAEHMMGRQLLFFSQIYHAKDPAIPVMDLNPKQMPPDYVFAHPDWSGQEEAGQMQRVSEFTRRFAYLLDGIDLDNKAPGSRWTLRGLLKQMDRHYGEHTANTVKKFDLPGWPAE